MSGRDLPRAQTQIDFAVGMSVFVVTVAMVLAFVPGILQPFEAGPQEATVASDRVADQLAGGALVNDTGEPYVLDRECLIGFFALENSDGDPSNDVDAYPENDGDVRGTLYDVTSATWWDGACNFDAGLGVFDRLAFEDSTLNVHVRLVADVDGDGDAGLLCVDANWAGTDVPDPDDRIIETDDPYDSGTECDMTGDDHDVAFETAKRPPTTTGSVVTSRRAVHIEGGLDDGTYDAALIVEVW